jgi:hypothetical protein
VPIDAARSTGHNEAFEVRAVPINVVSDEPVDAAFSGA